MDSVSLFEICPWKGGVVGTEADHPSDRTKSVWMALQGAVYREVYTDMAHRSHPAVDAADGKRHLRRLHHIANIRPETNRRGKSARDSPGLDSRHHCTFAAGKELGSREAVSA